MAVTAVATEASTYHGRDHRRLVAKLFGATGGIFDVADLTIAQTASPSGSVEVQPGAAIVPAKTTPVYHGGFFAYVDAVATVAITATGAQGRWDLIILEVRDAEISGATNDARIVVVQGTAAASPVYPTVTGYESYIVLGGVKVPASTSVITNAMLDATQGLALKWQPWSLPRGVIARSTSSASQSAIGSTYTDITSLTSGAIVYPAGRLTKVTFAISTLHNTTGGLDYIGIDLDGTTSDTAYETSAAGDRHTISGIKYLALSGGTHTIKARIKATVAGTVDVTGAPPAWLIVEDLGPA